MRTRTLVGPLSGIVTLTLLATVSLPGAAQARDHGDSRSAAAGKAALKHAEAVVSGRSTGDLSMALLDLSRNASGLSGSARAQAKSLLARPTDPSVPNPEDPSSFIAYGDVPEEVPMCGTYVCVHWVESGPQASTAAFASQALGIVDGIAETYRAAGYRSPAPDGDRGGNDKADIYLADVGNTFGAYGFCAPDVDDQGQPAWVPDSSAVSAYCVFDNDFAEFPRTPEENLGITAAHEFFHAVQFGYDANDDLWAYETTATWIEDEMYTDINDNLFFLPYGQMGDAATAPGYSGPGVPLDFSGYPYGNWTFWRYLSEKYPTAQAGLPTLVRTFWQNLDTTGGAPDRYSLQALDRTLAQGGTSTAQEYAGFSSANRTPAQSYSEGDSYPTPALAFGPVTFTKKVNSSTQTLTLDHLSSGTGSYLPFARGNSLQVKITMAAPSTGASAIVLVINKNGTTRRTTVPLNKVGIGQVQVPFGSDKVTDVEVTLVNGSSAMKDCFTDPNLQFACSGFGVDDGRSATVTARVLD